MHHQGPVPKAEIEARDLAQRGQTALEKGDATSAETLLAAAVKANPNNIEARRQYAEALWQQGQRNEALANEEKLCELAPDDAGAGVRLGEMNLAMNRIDDARKKAEQVLDLTPNEATAWALHARAEQASGDYPRALSDFHRALEFSPGDRQLLLETAELYRRMNQPQRALSTLTNLCETYGPGEEPQQVLYLKGLALESLDRPDDAAETFSVALDHGSPSPELLYRLGEASLAAGRPEQADRAIQQALAMDPNHQPSRALQGQIQLASRPVNRIFP
jgi:tetratricopeptide (TPR) repeat protein